MINQKKIQLFIYIMHPVNVKDINKGEKYDKLCENDLESLKKTCFCFKVCCDHQETEGRAPGQMSSAAPIVWKIQSSPNLSRIQLTSPPLKIIGLDKRQTLEMEVH